MSLPAKKKAKKAARKSARSQQSDVDARYVDLFNRLGRAKDPRDRAKLAQALSRLTFGSCLPD